ncbi:hypothetical protein CKO31_16480 [Thiohalocapsa halophila]|uniref:Multidrug resistance protein MdtA-like C-terminal permuted SH3 domain-containing protein n=1 Tax=Thiohalocapsa halophila TaxID=69359 RepID=A0ABS1CLG2_9GAMM|nr:hypothetical protein [Thiohalocapsa halophila]MBK1632304.1 hypothetical protein [Thiohalocapsa halophila]
MRLPVKLLLILLLAAGAGAVWWSVSRPHPVSVRIAEVERGRVEEMVANTRAGTVKACRRARLAPAMGGQIAQLEVHEVIAHPPDDPPLLAGYSADVEIVTAVAEDTLSVPTAAITPGFEDASDSVLVLGGDGRLASRDIETGLANWERTEVTAGLAAGERVVLSADRDGVEAGAAAVAEDAADG